MVGDTGGAGEGMGSEGGGGSVGLDLGGASWGRYGGSGKTGIMSLGGNIEVSDRSILFFWEWFCLLTRSLLIAAFLSFLHGE